MAKKLVRLRSGDTLTASEMKGEVSQLLYGEGAIQQHREGRRRVLYKMNDVAYFDLVILRTYEINDLLEYVAALQDEELTRARLVEVARDSKVVKIPSFKGFMVNSFEPIPTSLNGKPYMLNPTEGTATFIFDYEQFIVADDVVIVNVENPANFRMLREQSYLFPEMKCIFISRYPQSQYADIRRWLLSIRNVFIHFGDFDPAGISIFMNEYYRHLSGRATFFIPPEIESLLKKYGSRKRFDIQKFNFDKTLLEKMPFLCQLVELIQKLGVGMDQEILIGKDNLRNNS